MGPRLGGRGDWTLSCESILAELELQWGRGSVAAEIGRLADLSDSAATASMGPRLGGRGDAQAQVASILRSQALQWGRGSVAAEMPILHGRLYG